MAAALQPDGLGGAQFLVDTLTHCFIKDIVYKPRIIDGQAFKGAVAFL
jgi:hypothetical protein